MSYENIIYSLTWSVQWNSASAEVDLGIQQKDLPALAAIILEDVTVFLTTVSCILLVCLYIILIITQKNQLLQDLL